MTKFKMTIKGLTETIHCKCGHNEKIDTKKYKTNFQTKLESTITPAYVCPNCNLSSDKYSMEYQEGQLFKNRMVLIGIAVALIVGFVAFNFNDWRNSYHQQEEMYKEMKKKQEIKDYLKNE
jgi:hypothetical protein